MKCPMCDNQLEGRQKYCSAACRKKASRNKEVPENISSPRVEPSVSQDTWLVYGTADEPNKTWDRVCVLCGKNYTTPLQLMRFCSDECKSRTMVVIANGPHENYLKWAKL